MTNRSGMSRFPLLLILMAITFAILFAIGYLPRTARAKQIAQATTSVEEAGSIVSVVPVKVAPVTAQLILSGDVAAVTETGIFARADGYVKQRIADIGDLVKQGQLLAEIESPEVDQQLLQSRASLQQSRSALAQSEAALEQAKANLNLAEVTAQRWSQLVTKGVMARQDGDEKNATFLARKADVSAAEANVRAAKDNIAAAEANVQRLTEIKSFQLIRAPYDGVITIRNVTLGTLASGGSTSAVRELYRITQLNPLKVTVEVPQSEVGSIHVGLACDLRIRELAGKVYSAHVTRTANSLNPTSRTLTTEIQFENPGGLVLPGMYGEVEFKLQRKQPPLLVPSDAIITGRDGTRIATLLNGKVHFVKVTLGRDNGAQTEIVSGITATDLIIVNPSNDLRENAEVKPAREKT
jgi:RND family efflux transporter MFP subunit